MFYDRQRRNGAPVEVGQELDVRIEAVGEKGDGIAKVKGFVLFVPDAKEGQRLRVKVTKVLQKVGFAQVIGEAKSAPAPARPKTLSVSRDELDEGPAQESDYEDTEDFGEEPPESEEDEEDSAEEGEEGTESVEPQDAESAADESDGSSEQSQDEAPESEGEPDNKEE